MKNLVKNLMLLILFCTLIGCQSNIQNQENNLEEPILFQMQQYKIDSIGDNSGVSKLLSFLPQFDENFVQNMFALQTNVSPYGLMIYYEPLENLDTANMKFTQEMKIYSNYLFECIDNLGYIEYAYRKTPSNNKLEKSEYESILTVERPK